MFDAMDKAKQIFSIITVALNECQHMERLKHSIDHLRTPINMEIEIVLIDGGSTDGTIAKARELNFNKVIILPAANIPVCRNRGLQEATGDWLAFVDTDCELTEEWLMQALPFMDTSEPTILGWPVVPPAHGTWVQTAWHAHWSHKNPSDTDTPVTEQAFRLITTRNMILNRAAADALEGFDEQLATGEDTDFVFRAYIEKMNVVGVPTLQVIHHGEPATLRAFYRQQLWHANRSSYKKIAEATRGKVGGHAPRFTKAFLFCLSLMIVSIGLAVGLRKPLFVAGLLPWVAIILLPALLISWRARSARLVFQLLPLYTAYGLARSLDMLGFFRVKKTWK